MTKLRTSAFTPAHRFHVAVCELRTLSPAPLAVETSLSAHADNVPVRRAAPPFSPGDAIVNKGDISPQWAGLGAFVLALSPSHCTEALVAATWAPWAMSALPALGRGMFVCGVATTVAGTSTPTCLRWAVPKYWVASTEPRQMLWNPAPKAASALRQLQADKYGRA